MVLLVVCNSIDLMTYPGFMYPSNLHLAILEGLIWPQIVERNTLHLMAVLSHTLLYIELLYL